MNNRDRVLNLLDDGDDHESYVPAAFFIHFDEAFHHGRSAVDKHLEYYRYTGMDFVKIQFETRFPLQPEVERPGDWARLPRFGADFFQDQLDIVAGLVEAAGDEALVIVTLYSPFMCAGQAARPASSEGRDLLTEHLKETPEQTQVGIEIMTESLLLFVRECVKRGVDGFYTSTQGRERFRFEDPTLFDRCIRPFDLAVMEEVNRSCPFNILHICDYHGGYDDLTPFLDYPGQVVNCSLELGSKRLTGREVSRMFGRPYMGGLDRHGVIASGTEAEIEAAVEGVLHDAPDRFILGADCTLPGDIDWDNIRTAIASAHGDRT